MLACALQVRDVRMISDRNSRRSKGIAYIEFVDSSSVPLAIGLTGQRLLGVPIIVQASQVMASWFYYTPSLHIIIHINIQHEAFPPRRNVFFLFCFERCRPRRTEPQRLLTTSRRAARVRCDSTWDPCTSTSLRRCCEGSLSLSERSEASPLLDFLL